MKKIVNYLLSFLFIFAIVCTIPFHLQKTADALSSENRTIFVVESKYVANTNSGVYIYDNSDASLKKLDSTPANSQSFSVGECLSMCSSSNNIYMLTQTGLIVFDTTTNTHASYMVNELKSYHTNISVSIIDDNDVLCIYPNDTAYNQEVIYGTYDASQGFQFYSISFLTNEITENSQISLLSFINVNNQSYLIRAYGRSINSYPISALNSNLSLTTTTTLSLTENAETSPIVAIESLYYNDNSYLVVSYESKTYLYLFSVKPSSFETEITFLTSISHRYIEDIFTCTDVSVNGNQITLLADNSYYLLQYDNTLSITSQMTNPICDIRYRDAKDFTFYTTTTSTNFIAELDDFDTTLTLPENSHIVEIADVYLSDNTKLSGYKFVMYTLFTPSHNEFVGTNIYGYVITDNNCLTEDTQIKEYDTVKVYQNTALYKTPSIITNNTSDYNQIIYNISSNLPVNIISYISGYKNNYGQNQTTYALVQVNGKFGFIDVKNILSSDKRVILIMPNATTINESVVYEYANTSSNILHILPTGSRVKIVETRNRDGYVKVAYNDSSSNYYEGYIKAEHLSTDHYSSIQIIGLVLVIVNAFFLVILIVTKKKVVK